MTYRESRKRVLARRLGLSEDVLEQYLALKQAEVTDEPAVVSGLGRRMSAVKRLSVASKAGGRRRRPSERSTGE